MPLLQRLQLLLPTLGGAFLLPLLLAFSWSLHLSLAPLALLLTLLR